MLYTADQTTLLYYPAGSMTTAFTVPNTVTTINAHAFDNAKYLKSVTLPESVRTIENEAFYNCTKLESIALNEGLTTIGDNVFYYNGLTSVRLPASLTTIGKSIFYYCRYLTAIEVAEDSNKFTSVDGVLYSKDKTQLIAFPANYAQMDYTIPEGVTGIEAYAFYGCGITSVTFPSSLRTIGSYAFSGCEELTKVELPEGFQVVGEDAFYSCDALTTVIIPASCTEVKSYAFYSNKSMTGVTIKGMDTNLDSWSPFEYANENLVFYAQAGSTAEALCAKKEYTFVPTTFDAPVVETPQPIIVTPEPVIVMPTPVIVTPTPAPQAEEEGWDCPNCNAHWVNAKFCGDCGTRRPIAQNCPGCGYVLPTDKIMNFCPECGFKLIAN